MTISPTTIQPVAAALEPAQGRSDTVDLFAGAGGLTVGLAAAGLNVVAGFDNSVAAIETYRANHAHPANLLDLTDVDAAVDAIRPYRPAILAGGPPCQDFSQAGQRIEGARADLTHNFVRIGIELECEYLLMENVERALRAGVYQASLRRLSAAGYGLTSFVLDASFFGVPQRRKRSILMAKFGAEDNWISPPQRLSAAPLTVGEYLRDELDIEHYYRHPRSYSRRSVFSIKEPSPTVRGTNRPVPKGHPQHAGDTADVGSVRALTMYERARIQTFPPDYHWVGSRTAIEQMIGNAVPCALAEALGQSLRSHILSNGARLLDKVA